MNSSDNTATSAIPLQIEKVKKSFDKKNILNEISLDIEKGEVFGLIGLNGIGKTTLIKIIIDLLSADEGEIKIFGTDSKKSGSRQNLAYMPEKFHPSKYLKGHEYLSLAMSYHGLKYDNNTAEKEAEKLGLDPTALGKRISSYSKGMGQKLGLIGAIMSKTPLLILDEPMSGLDPKARIMLKDRLLALRNEGTTIFLSSHILADMDEICDRVGILHNGEMLFVGTPDEFRKSTNCEQLERAFLSAIDKYDSQEKAA